MEASSDAALEKTTPIPRFNNVFKWSAPPAFNSRLWLALNSAHIFEMQKFGFEKKKYNNN